MMEGTSTEHIAQVLEAILFLLNNKSLADVVTVGEEKNFFYSIRLSI